MIRLTLQDASEIFDWDKFCEKRGWSLYARNEGGGNVEDSLSVEEFKELLNKGG